MKLIDLLVKIANNEQVPERIKIYPSFRYTYRYDTLREEYTYLNEVTNERLDNDIFVLTLLNREVEILESAPAEDTPKEDKKIEHLKINEYTYSKIATEFGEKINEIIDKLNGE